jgi:hypothetical protein
MENFCGSPNYAEQIGLLAAVGSPAVAKLLGHLDPEFQSHFGYILADMNSRSDHLFAFLKAKLLCAHVRWLLVAGLQQQEPADRSQPETVTATATETETETEMEAETEPQTETEGADVGGQLQQVGGRAECKGGKGEGRVWLTPVEEAAFRPLWREALTLLGLPEGSAARREAEGLFDIDPVAHVHKTGFSLPGLRDHFRRSGVAQIAAIEAAADAEGGSGIVQVQEGAGVTACF